jgi:hypothetical protein
MLVKTQAWAGKKFMMRNEEGKRSIAVLSLPFRRLG